MKQATQMMKVLICLMLALSLTACAAAPAPASASEPAAVSETPAAASEPAAVSETPAAEAPQSTPAAAAEKTETAAISFKDTPYKDSYTPGNITFYENSDRVQFTTQTIDGESLDSQSLFAQAKVTMITLWTTTCGVCVREMPTWEKLSQEYAGTGVQIIGVCCSVFSDDDPNLQRAQDIMAQTGTTYTQFIANPEMLSGFLSNVMYVPTTMFVDSEGYEICPSVIGGLGEQGWIDIIETIVHEQA